MISHTADIIRALEEKLLLPTARKDRDFLEKILAPDFIEFGASGKIFDKAMTIKSLIAEQSDLTDIKLSNFSLREIAEHLVLATYALTVTKDGSQASSLRSSLWQYTPSGWQIEFHQGTRVA